MLTNNPAALAAGMVECDLIALHCISLFDVNGKYDEAALWSSLPSGSASTGVSI